MSKHTPGPWHAKTLTSTGIHVLNDGGYVIASLSYSQAYKGSHHANARLIAAAPELLEALTQLAATARTFRNVPKDEQEWTPLDDEALNAAFAALAKVKGE